MSLQALTPAAHQPHRRADDLILDSCRLAKRSKRAADDEYMAGCLVALRSGGGASSLAAADTSAARIHKCSVCGKSFSSHQALGGHKASHRSKASMSNPRSDDAANFASAAPDPHRPHSCSTCGRSFLTGQALGGHMRKHYGGSVSSSNGDGNGNVAAISHNFDLNLPPSQELDC